MFRRFMKGRLALGGLAVIGALALAAGAYAYFTSTGTSSPSTAAAGNAGSFGVTLVPTGSVTLYPTAPGDTNFSSLNQPYTGVVTNNGSGQQQVSKLTANIASVTPTTGNTCDTSNFSLYATGGSGWSVDSGGQSASTTTGTGTGLGTVTLPQDIAGGAHFPYDGIAVYMVDSSSSQNGCQGAQVNVTVTAS